MGRRSIAVGGAVTVALVAVAGVVRWQAEDDGPLSEEEAEAIVGDYLDAMEREDYRDAARLLAVGGRPAGNRSDLAPLALDDRSVGEIAAGLADYCRDGCLAATAIAVDGDPDGRGRHVAVVTFGEPRGHPLERSFVVGEDDDGRPYVRGLPPAGTGMLPYTPR